MPDLHPQPGGIDHRPRDDRYRMLVEATSQVVWSASADGLSGDLEHSQRWWAELTGQSVEEQRSHDHAWLRVVHPDDRDTAERVWTDAIRDAVAYHSEFRVRASVGGWRVVRVCGVPVRGPDGGVAEWFGTLDDITVRRDAEEALQASEQRYRALVTAASDVIYRMNADWTEMHPMDGRGLVASNTEPIRDWLTRNIPPVEHDRVRAAVREAIDRKSLFELEHRVIRPDGTIGWTLSRAAPILNARGDIVEWFGTARDITDRRRAEDELADIRSRMEAALEAGAIGTWSWDVLQDRFHADASLARIFSVDPGVVSGGPIARIMDAIHPQDRDFVAERIRQALESGSSYETEYRVTGPDGIWRWINARGQIERDAHGHPVRFPGVVIDVTEHRAAQEALTQLTQESDRRKRLYETILSNTPDFAYVFDLEHRFVYANETLLKMWGKTWDEAIGRTCHELGYEPWHASMHDEEIEHVKATRSPIRGEVPFDGTFGRRIYEYIFVPVLGEDGQVEAVAGTTRDVTERQQMELALRQAARRKDDFIALLAHELRNPLAPIRNGLQILRVTDDPTSVDRARDMMERQLAHMVRLIDDLLDVSRVTRNKMELRRRTVTLAEILNHAMETAEPAIRQAGHALSVELPAEPVHLHADTTRLAQVFSNLLNNSARYTPAPGRIVLRAEVHPDAVCVSVEDNGLGIPEDALPRIFDMFSQVDRGPEHGDGRGAGGLGLGLALVKGLVEMHGGTVKVRSTVRQGSVFTVRLPTVANQPAANTPEPTPRGAPAKRRVLVVDDNLDSAESMSALLGITGNEVTMAHDGHAAVATAETFRPDLILMDIGLPGLDGLDATKKIREQPWGAAPTIIALTGWGQDSDRKESREAGCDAHLVKPVDFAELERLLATLPPRSSAAHADPCAE